MPKVSIIIPVYNTEDYLEECLDSILEQEYADLEVLIIDDGSSDNSKNIALKYVEKYNNFKLFDNHTYVLNSLSYWFV